MAVLPKAAAAGPQRWSAIDAVASVIACTGSGRVIGRPRAIQDRLGRPPSARTPASAPADGVSTFGDPASPTLRAGPVIASVACTGDGSILVAATTAASPGPLVMPPADRWTRVACAGLPRDATPASVDLPDARGGETVLLVERRPRQADDLLGYSVVVGQPVDVACDTPTPALVARIGLRSSSDGAAQTGLLGAYQLPAGSRVTQPGELAVAAALPVLTRIAGSVQRTMDADSAGEPLRDRLVGAAGPGRSH